MTTRSVRRPTVSVPSCSAGRRGRGPPWPARRAPPPAARGWRRASPRASRSAQQRALARRPDAREVVEDRRPSSPCRGGSVVRDREAVRLVAHALQQLELRRVVRQRDGLADAREEDLLDPLGERDDGDAAARGSPGARARPAASWPLPPSITTRLGSAANESSRSASCGERSCWRLVLGVAPREHLLHRGEVVGAPSSRRGS